MRRPFLSTYLFCILLSLFISLPVIAVHYTATWTNGDGTGNWSDPNNWDIGMVPINQVDTFDVIIPVAFTVYFDVDDPTSVTDLQLASTSTLVIDPGHSLTALDDVSLDGTLQTNGATTDFICSSAGATLGNGAKLYASNGGGIACTAADYSSTSLNANATLFSADGTDALVDLSSLLTIDARFTTNHRTHTISATNFGVIDLSEVGTLYGSASSYSLLNIHVGSEGNINLYHLTDILGGYTKFDIDTSYFQLPSLKTALQTTFDIEATSVLSMLHLNTVNRCNFVIPDGGEVYAPSLMNFLNSQITLNPSRTLTNGPLGNIDNSRIALTEGMVFGTATNDITATSYSSAGLSGNYTLFSANGTNTLLDLSSIEVFNAGFVNNHLTQTVSATDSGTIDLSSVGTLYGSASSYSRLKFVADTGGEIDLTGLQDIPSGYTTFDIDIPSFSLPALLSATGVTLDASNVTSINLPVLTSLTNSSLVLANDASIIAPNLTSFTKSSATLNPSQTFTSGGLSDIDNSRITISEGKVFGTLTGDITATSYSSTGLNGNYTIFSATGTGTLLDLSSIEMFNAAFVNNHLTQTISATDFGMVDLSSVGTLNGSASSYSRLKFVADTGGEIDLTGLQDIPTGYTTFDIDIPDFNLPSLETATGIIFDASAVTTIGLPVLTSLTGSQLTIADGGVIDAPQLTSLTSSILNLNPAHTFINGTLTHIDNTRIALSGGAEFGVSTGDIDITSYSSSGLGGNLTIFSADGAGTILDLSTVQSINSGPTANHQTQIYSATNQGTLDLSSLGSFAGSTSSYSQAELNISSGGQMLFGDLSISRYSELNITGSDSSITTGSLTFNTPSELAVTEGGTIHFDGDFMYNVTGSFNADAGIFEFVSGTPVQLEVGGQNLGLGGAASGNFGLGQLIVGNAGQATTLSLVDLNDNQGDGPANEALYLYGSGGMAGLQIGPDSQLIIGNIDVYAAVDGNMVHLNSLFTPGVKWIPFDEGIITLGEYTCSLTADLTGDCVVNLADFAEMADEWLQCGDTDCP